jgi:hypothetical protein
MGEENGKNEIPQSFQQYGPDPWWLPAVRVVKTVSSMGAFFRVCARRQEESLGSAVMKS